VERPLTIALFNQSKNKNIDEKNRRLIAKIVPLCKAYNFHLILVNYKIDLSPIDFTKSIAQSTSIGKNGKIFVELAKKGLLQIKNLPLPQNCGEQIICTSNPDEIKAKNKKDIVELADKEKICLIFGIDKISNQISKKIRNQAKYHFDISNKKIKFELDTEIGAVCNLIFKLRKE